MNQQHHRRMTRVALFEILAPAFALLLLTACGCVVSDNLRPPTPTAVAAQPSNTIVRPPTPLAPEARVQQAAYVSAEGLAIPEPQSTAGTGLQAPAATETGPAKGPESDLHPLAAEELPVPAASGA